MELATLQSRTEHQHLCGHAEFGSYSGQVILMPPEFLKDRWPTGIGIDVCLALEIQSLWQRGIKTLEHCCGHGRKEGYIAVADECVNDMLSLGYVKADHESGLIFLPKTVLQSRAEQEPVAWRWRPKGTDRWIYDPNFEWLNSQLDSDIDKEPIYASPPADAARIAELETALTACREQFAFYAQEHRSAGKIEKAETNEGFRDLADAALHAKLKGDA